MNFIYVNMKKQWNRRMNMKLLDGIYLITGVTGFIGSLVMKKLMDQPEYLSGDIKILGFVRNIKKAEQMYQDYNTAYIKFICSDILDFVHAIDKYMKIEEEKAWVPEYIIHCAATTQSAIMISNPVETEDGIVIGTRNVLEVARSLNVKSMVYLSSMEVYGEISETEELVTEDMLGDLNLFSMRSSYPLGKRMAELYCYSYFKEYDVPVKIARLAQTFGADILPGENRVFAQFAKAVRENNNIVLHTSGDSMGNYCDSNDVVEALFILLYNGLNGEAYNVVNEKNTMRIREMADLVADKIAHGKIKVVYDIPEENKYGYADTTGLRLSSSKLRKLGWRPSTDLEEMYRNMMK